MKWDQIPDWAYSIANTLLQVLQERDPYTYGHCRRVARNARLLARAAGLSEEEQRIIEFSSMFHDLGKIGIPDRILLKPGKLTKDEEEIMKTHPLKSEAMIQPLAGIPFFKALLPGIRHHHERVDGRGYPDGCKGEEIPLHARIILISDTHDAMTTTRPYRKGLDHAYAYKELRKFAGRQFDPHLVNIFLQAHPKWEKIEEELTDSFIATHFRRAA